MSGEKIKESLSLGVVIPTHWIVTVLISGVFTAGILYNKLDTIAESYKKTEGTVAVMQNQQITNTNDIGHLKDSIGSHENRLNVVEKALIEDKQK